MGSDQNMTGWKSKVGTITMAVGTTLLGASGVAPNPELGVWLQFAGTLITGFGTALLGWGIAHKIEKSKDETCP
jgi:hypothetical protein